MGNNKQNSRRDFFARLTGSVKKEKVKMLTPDGQLVEVDKDILDAIRQKQKATNKDILNWMDNPSKKDK